MLYRLGITCSYTLEASFCGSDRGANKGYHFGTPDLEDMGRVFAAALLDTVTPAALAVHAARRRRSGDTDFAPASPDASPAAGPADVAVAATGKMLRRITLSLDLP